MFLIKTNHFQERYFWTEYVFLDFKQSLEGDFAINVDVQNPEDISLEVTAQSR